MRNLAITILLALTATLVACSGFFSASNSSNSNAANAELVAAPDDNANLDIDADLEDANANANVVNALPARRPLSTPTPDLLAREAPDDSVITAENDPDGDLVETRIFKNHDMVAKVERVLPASRRDGTIRVFLRNGKVYEFPVSRMKNALKDSPDDIVRSVGDTVVAAEAQASNKAAAETKNAPGMPAANAAVTPRKQ
jgi:hypothetical protein